MIIDGHPRQDGQPCRVGKSAHIAKALGLTFQLTLLGRADEVIE